MEDGSKKNIVSERNFSIVYNVFRYYELKENFFLFFFSSLLLLLAPARHCVADMICSGDPAEKTSISYVL